MSVPKTADLFIKTGRIWILEGITYWMLKKFLLKKKKRKNFCTYIKVAELSQYICGGFHFLSPSILWKRLQNAFL